MELVIQSGIHQIEQYREILDSDVMIENIDFAYPSNYGLDGERLLESWQSSDYLDQVVGIHGSYYDLIYHSIDPQITEIARKRYLWNLNIADQLNAEYTIFHTNYQPERRSKSYLQRWVRDHYRFLQKYSSEFDTQITIENMRDPHPDLLDLLQQTGNQSTRYCLDIGHIQLYSEVETHNWFATLGKNSSVIHIKEQQQYGEELALGSGDLDWVTIFGYIVKYCNNSYLVLEMEGVDTIRQSMDFIEQLGVL